MKTIKQIADELGVSKQKVYRFIVRNHITASSEVKQSKLYDEATEMLIKQGILEDEPYQKSHHEAHQNHINDTVSEAVIELLRKELEQKNEQLQEKDKQIERLQEALGIAQENVKAAQLLQANAEKKLLENKENPLNQEDKGVYDLYAKKQDEWKEAMRKNEELQKELEEEKNKRWWEKLLRK